MRGLTKRLDALETKSTPPVFRRVHLVGKGAGESNQDAIANHHETVAPGDQVIFLCGWEPDRA